MICPPVIHVEVFAQDLVLLSFDFDLKLLLQIFLDRLLLLGYYARGWDDERLSLITLAPDDAASDAELWQGQAVSFVDLLFILV